jgi:hypothetical protein
MRQDKLHALFEIKCGACRSHDLLVGGRGHSELLAWVHLTEDGFDFTTYRRRGADEWARMPGTERGMGIDLLGEKTAAYGMPPYGGLRLRCRRGRHRMQVSEQRLHVLIDRLPADADVLYLPAA